MTWGTNRPPMPKGWDAIRARVLDEEPWCRMRCGRPSTTVDHIIPRERGGGEGRENLAGMCGPCHRTKTARIDSKTRPSRKRPPERHPGLV